jgi:hypothetical protein
MRIVQWAFSGSESAMFLDATVHCSSPAFHPGPRVLRVSPAPLDIASLFLAPGNGMLAQDPIGD